ncbi:AMP-dependent synthetase and ligase family protein [Actinidia rufa]|uniref:AMP-dependent synthetase and ligase family protein n=1 Tax=Actinidia rufa TaxID=165716 RepID=A0A7J0GV06_9ERIC|nr:AMP-dependent synthetase and ligase family protein [Actinidia rufa]
MGRHHRQGSRKLPTTAWPEKRGFDSQTGIYNSLHQLGEHQKIRTRPDLDTATFVLSQFPHLSESRVASHAYRLDHEPPSHLRATPLVDRLLLTAGPYHALGVHKGDVVFVLSPNSLLGVATTTTHPIIHCSYPILIRHKLNNVFLCFITMFHIYGLNFYALGLFCSVVTTVVMQRFDFQSMLNTIQTHRVNNIAAVPPVILGLVKYDKSGHDLSLRRVSLGATPLSKEPLSWFPMKMLKARSGSCGRLVLSFNAKMVDYDSGMALPPCREGDLWLKSPVVMKGYLGNEAATAATIDSDGWLRTGDLCGTIKQGEKSKLHQFHSKVSSWQNLEKAVSFLKTTASQL